MGWRIQQQPGKRELLQGHLQTILPTLRHGFRPLQCPSEPLRFEIPNEFGDPIIHRGYLSHGPDPQSLVVILHGLGGTPDRGYCLESARAISRLGLSSLRLSMRGANEDAEDLYHAGFIESLPTILADPIFDSFTSIYLLGFSLGGNVALRAAFEQVDPRIRAVAAICPPLDLHASQVHIDDKALNIYRQSVLSALIASYPRVSKSARRHGIPLPPTRRIQSVRSLREWDALTVVPRFGFDSVEHYYKTQSSGPLLARQNTPTLIIASPADPMIPARSLRPYLAMASDQVIARFISGGGHVFFPRHARAHLPLPETAVEEAPDHTTPPLYAEIIRWLQSHA